MPRFIMIPLLILLSSLDDFVAAFKQEAARSFFSHTLAEEPENVPGRSMGVISGAFLISSPTRSPQK